VNKIEKHRSYQERDPSKNLKKLSVNSTILKNSMIYAIKQN